MLSSTSAAGLMVMASLFAAVNGHMIMKTPNPYGPANLNNSPLVADGSDFPCKQRPGVYDDPVAANTMAIGESQTLSFTGSAVHGGGSCQVSLTKDVKPTKDSQWQVIHSIEGGCPASAEGNLSGDDATTFKFAIPEGIAPGSYALAWTWFNKIGNREMYMNCAPVTVTASKKRYAPTPAIKRDVSFPAMAVANLAGINKCVTNETYDYVFADPGTSVDRICTSSCFTLWGLGASSASDTPKFCSFAIGEGYSSGASSGTSSGASSATSAAAASSVASSAISQSSPGVFASVSSSAPAASATAAASAASVAAPSAASVAATSAASAAAPSSTGTASSGTGSSAGNGTAAQGASCSTEGQTNCAADGKSYLECASGYWQVMPVAAGTSCQAGVSDSVRIVVSPRKREHVREHLHRRSGHA